MRRGHPMRKRGMNPHEALRFCTADLPRSRVGLPFFNSQRACLNSKFAKNSQDTALRQFQQFFNSQ